MTWIDRGALVLACRFSAMDGVTFTEPPITIMAGAPLPPASRIAASMRIVVVTGKTGQLAAKITNVRKVLLPRTLTRKTDRPALQHVAKVHLLRLKSQKVKARRTVCFLLFHQSIE